MAQTIKTFELDDEFNEFEPVKRFFLTKWVELTKVPNVFKYQLNVEKQKILDGELKLLVQLNEDRTTKRRKPQKIDSITPAFDDSAFNFTKIDDQEYLFDIAIKRKQMVVSFVTNQSPLTPYHSLICPNLREKQPQILTRDSIEVAMRLLLAFDDRKFRIGYNSPGALASVNHLHMHLIAVDEQLYVENAVLKHLTKKVYVLDDAKYPAKGYCFPLFDKTQINDVSNDIFILTTFLNKCQKAHNVFFTFSSAMSSTVATMTMTDQPPTTATTTNSCLTTATTATTTTRSDENILKTFVIPRDKCCTNKEICNFNVAFCEICGYVPVGDEKVYDTITEDFVRTEITAALGNVVADLNDSVKALYEN